MKVKDLIRQLRQLDPEATAYIEATVGGDSYYYDFSIFSADDDGNCRLEVATDDEKA